MSMSLIVNVRKADGIPGPVKAVLFILASYADDEGGSIFVSQTRLARESGFSYRTVQNAVKWLSDEGILEVLLPPGKAPEFRIQTDTLANYRPKRKPDPGRTCVGTLASPASLESPASLAGGAGTLAGGAGTLAGGANKKTFIDLHSKSDTSVSLIEPHFDLVADEGVEDPPPEVIETELLDDEDFAEQSTGEDPPLPDGYVTIEGVAVGKVGWEIGPDGSPQLKPGWIIAHGQAVNTEAEFGRVFLFVADVYREIGASPPTNEEILKYLRGPKAKTKTPVGQLVARYSRTPEHRAIGVRACALAFRAKKGVGWPIVATTAMTFEAQAKVEINPMASHKSSSDVALAAIQAGRRNGR